MATKTLDPKKVEKFSAQLLDRLNGGALSLMISIGHRTGLFDTMADGVPGTAREIADRASMDPRYVREWLGAMVVGGIVEYSDLAGTYTLCPEHAACLTREAAPNNLAAFAQYVGLLGMVEDKIVRCFRNGGGVSYSEYPRFQEVMSEDSGQTVMPALLGHILPLEEGLKARLEKGIDVLEVGFGMGRALRLLARTYPRSRFTGYELSEEGTLKARRAAEVEGLRNVRFEVRDAEAFEDREAFDLVLAFDAIHDQRDPAAVLRNISRALRSDGLFLMQDIDASSNLEENLGHPMGPLLYTISTMHCMTVSLAVGGKGLGTMWGRQAAVTLLKEAGLASVRIETLPHDIQNCYYLARKS